MKAGVQTLFSEAGEAACLAFCYTDVAQEYLKRELDPCSSLYAGIEFKFIKYNEKDANDNDNFYVDDPEGFLEYLTGIPWEVRKETPDYIPRPGDYVIRRFERIKTGATIAHFNRPLFDSLTDSATVRYGKLASYRICRPKK